MTIGDIPDVGLFVEFDEWIASMIAGTDARQGLLTNIIVGIIGAFVGGFVFRMFGSSNVNGLNLYSLLVAVVGSVILLVIYKAVTGRRI